MRTPPASRRWRAWVALTSASLVLMACSTNPVTGRNELLLVSEDWELQVGEQQYAPLRQSQGGDYVVDPTVEAYVREVGQRLAARSDRRLPYEFHVINDSTPNAWALPGGKISINRGLLTELDNEAQLAAVLGHEIVHAAARHGARGQTRGIGLQLAVMTATIAGARQGYGEIAQLGSTIGAQLVNSRYGRDAELESDRYGMEYMRDAGYDPNGAVELQQTFVRLSEGRRSDWLSGLFASHPPSPQRVAANRDTAARLPKGGELGRDRYRAKLARLIKSKPAYDRFDQAQKALAGGKVAEAESLTRQAITLEPKEGHFHSLLGDIASGKKDWAGAKRSYDQAISLNDGFFYYYLQRGKANQAVRNTRAAEADYRRSLALMPTSDAQTALGNVAAARGDTEQAKRYFAAAAQANDASGQQARAALAGLSPPSSAAAAVLVRKGVTPNGTFAFELVNQTGRPLRNLRVAMRSTPAAEPVVQTLSGVLPAGSSRTIDTGRAMSRQQAARIDVRVIGADIAGKSLQ